MLDEVFIPAVDRETGAYAFLPHEEEGRLLVFPCGCPVSPPLSSPEAMPVAHLQLMACADWQCWLGGTTERKLH